MTNLSTVEIDRLARRIVELGGNAGVTQRCVPLAAGGLNPDLRVNYEFGLVLGVEEFRQEQFYHLQKNYLHNRALHGYGVVSGLQIDLEQIAAGDIRVTVGEGVGVDQCGRTFIVRSAQCANLRAWLERNRADLDLAVGERSLYVVGTYDECKDALVAIAGQPCASSEQSLAASRIRDSFNITLRAEPPAMSAWDALRRLAALMTRVRIINQLPASESDEAAISARVRVIDDPIALAALDVPVAGYYGGELPEYWKLPAEEINETLDRIFMVWVTEVRPRLAPAVIDGCGTADPLETGILLGRLDLTIDNANDPIAFVFGEDTPAFSYDERPYLLQTQLIQELLFLGVGNERKPARLFGSLFVQDEYNLVAWVHHPELLAVPGELDGLDGVLEVYVNGQRREGSLSSSNRAGIRARNVFAIRLNEPVPAGARVEVRFLLAGWRVGEDEAEGRLEEGGGLDRPDRSIGRRNILEELRRTRLRTGGTTPLLASIDEFDFAYVGRDGDTITVYAFAERLPEVREFAVPSLRFVEDVPRIRLWFPFDAPLNLGEAREDGWMVRVRENTRGQEVAFTVEATNDRHVWWLVPVLAGGRGRAAELRRLVETITNGLLTIQFNAQAILVDNGNDGQESLLAAMERGQYGYVGYDTPGRDGPSITVAYVPEAPALGGLSREDVIRLIVENRQPVPPSLPLASLQFMSTNFDNVATFELWFHFDRDWARYEAVVDDDFNMVVFAEVMDRNQPNLVELPFERRRVQERPNVFRVDVFTDGGPERLQYLRFVFPVERPFLVRSEAGSWESLQNFMQDSGVRFDNLHDMEQIENGPAVVLYGRAVMQREG
jgi:hypothetical protein